MTMQKLCIQVYGANANVSFICTKIRKRFSTNCSFLHLAFFYNERIESYRFPSFLFFSFRLFSPLHRAVLFACNCKAQRTHAHQYIIVFCNTFYMLTFSEFLLSFISISMPFFFLVQCNSIISNSSKFHVPSNIIPSSKQK